jgi:hypothetical protein
MRFRHLLVLGSAVLCGVGFSVEAIAREPVGRVECGSTDGSTRSDTMWFAALSPSPGGLNLLIVEETGPFVLTLDQNLVVQAASSLVGQTLSGWNLVAYDGTPLQVSPDGTFSLTMMVSTRSTCSFEGTAVFLEGAEELLPN